MFLKGQTREGCTQKYLKVCFLLRVGGWPPRESVPNFGLRSTKLEWHYLHCFQNWPSNKNAISTFSCTLLLLGPIEPIEDKNFSDGARKSLSMAGFFGAPCMILVFNRKA